jgi:uncharacterized protein DUF4375
VGIWSRLFGKNKPRPYSQVARELTNAIISGETHSQHFPAAASDALRRLWLENRKDVIGLPLPELLREHPDQAMSEVGSRLLEKAVRVGKEQLQAAERRIDAVLSFKMEVGNGGIHQYFLNSAGNDAVLASKFMCEIGATKAAAILDQAMARFGESQVPSNRRERLILLEKRPITGFSDLNEAFFNLPDGYLYDRLRTWMLAHIDEVDLPPGSISG